MLAHRRVRSAAPSEPLATWTADEQSREPIGVIGAGYVGPGHGRLLRRAGHEVWLRRHRRREDRARCASGEVPIYEPGLRGARRAQRERLHFDDRPGRGAGARAAAVRRRGHAADLLRATPTSRAVQAVVDALPDVGPPRAGDEVAPCPAGTGAAIKRRSREQGKAASATCPARSSSRRARRSTTSCEPDRVVVGDDGGLGRRRAWRRCTSRSSAPLVRTDVASAEMIKLASNAFLATKISFINEIANVCEETGADVVEVARGMGLDDRDRRRSSCRRGSASAARASPRTSHALKQLAGNSGYHFQLLTAVIEVNELQKRRVVGKLQKHLGSLVGKEIALLGLAFKPNTDDMREASSLVLAARLQARGRARARLRPGRRGRGARADRPASSFATRRWRPSTAPTPSCSSPSGRSSPSSTGARSRQRMRGTLLVDGRNVLDPATRPRGRARLRGHRRAAAGAAPRRADAGADPRRRRGHAAAAADLDGARSRSCRWSTGRSSPTCSTGCAATASTTS